MHTLSFKRALKAALREDPDIILVGEMRDLETIAIAIEMAETGHLVFGTLHTSTAASTVDRIIDQFPAGQQNQIRTQLAESLKGVIAQTLCRTADGKGRRAALEVLICTKAVGSNIREGKTHQIPLAMQTGKNQGMVDLNRALLNLVESGQVAPEEAHAKAIDKEGLEREYARLNIKLPAPGESTPPPKESGAKKATQGQPAAQKPRPQRPVPQAPPGSSASGGHPAARRRAAPPKPQPRGPEAAPQAAPAAPAAEPAKKRGWFS